MPNQDDEKGALEVDKRFNYDSIPKGYYHYIAESGNPIRRAWHLQKFERVLDCLPQLGKLSLLDVGCFAGTFLSLAPQERFVRQVGVDILPKQIDFANAHFGTDYREFKLIEDFVQLKELDEQFNCVTLIEVIEHLTDEEIGKMFEAVIERLKPNGKLVISTPNYTSAWPAIEIALNHLSEITYEEQHLNKLNYFTVLKRLKVLYPPLEQTLSLDFKTTTHFISPFLAFTSLKFARRLSQLFPHNSWHFPFGNIILMVFTKKEA